MSEEPGAAPPVSAEPDDTEPTAAEPDAAEPTAAEPDATEPTAAEPDAAEPVAAEPVVAEPIAAEPDFDEPDAAEPAAAADTTLAQQTPPEDVRAAAYTPPSTANVDDDDADDGASSDGPDAPAADDGIGGADGAGGAAPRDDAVARAFERVCEAAREERVRYIVDVVTQEALRARAIVRHHGGLFALVACLAALLTLIVVGVGAGVASRGAPAHCAHGATDDCAIGAMGRRLAGALPLAQGYPSEECEPLAAGARPDPALLGALRTHLCVPGAPLALTARHVGRRECVAVVRPARGAVPVVVVNPRRGAASVATRASEERDSLCRIDRALRFVRPLSLSLRYTDERGRAVEREFEGDAAAGAAHVVDVLEALRVCED